MKTKSRILAVILTLAMTFSILPMTALAAEVVGPPQNQQLVAGPPKGEAGPTTGDPEVVPPTVPGPTDDTTPEAPPAELPAPPAENPGPVVPHDPDAGTRAVNEAKIDTTEYATFALALAAAKANDTITLLKDCKFANSTGEGTTISKNLTITSDAPNKKLTLQPNAGGYHFLVVDNGVTLTLTNIDMATTGTNDMFHNRGTININGCNFTAVNPVNGIFNITETGSVKMESGTLKATGFITNAGKGLSLKTGTGADAVDIKGGTIRLKKDAVITLLGGSAATTTPFNIQTAADAVAGDKIVNGAAEAGAATALASQITVNGGTNTDFTAQVATNDLTLARTNNHYVKSDAADTGTGTYGNPYKTLAKAYAAATAGGEIRLLSDLTATEATTFGDAKTVTVTSYTDAATPKTGDGWTVKRGSALKGEMLKVDAGTVNLNHITLDGAGDSVTSQMVSVAASGTLNLDTGATLQNNKHTGTGVTGGAIVTAGAVVMNNGSAIKNNETAQYGGGVFVDDSGTFTMNGGTISGNKATYGDASGGGICIKPTAGGTGTVTITGGEITGNSCGANGSAIHGGDVGSTIKIVGTANITGNISRTNPSTALIGGAVYPFKSTVTVGSTAKITGNTATKIDGTYKNPVSNLWLGNVGSAITMKIDPNLSAGANIGVTGTSNTADVATEAVSGDAAFVHSDNPKLSVKYEASGTKLTLADETHYYVKADAPVGGNGSFGAPFQYLEQARNAIGTDAGTYNVHIIGEVHGSASRYLVDGSAHAKAGQLKALAGQTVNLIGDGENAKILPTAGNSAVLYVGGAGASMTATNVVLQGFDQANFGNSAMGGADSAVVYVDAGGNFTMGDAASITGNYNTCNAATPTGAGAGWAGGSVYVKGTLNMEPGSSITGGNGVNGYSSYSGGVVINGGTLNMTGGSISENKGAGGAGVYVDGNGNINLSGTPVVSGNESDAGVANNIYLANERTIKLTSALTSGANIGVYVETPLTVAGTTKPVAVSDGTYVVKDTDAAYVHSDNGGDAIVQFKDGGSAGSDTSDTLVLKKLVADVYVKSDGNDAAPGTGAKEHPYKTLAKAYAEVATGGTIHVMDDLDPVTATTNFNVDKAITITSCKTDGAVWEAAGDTHTIKNGMADTATTHLLDITAGAVNLKNIIVDGGAIWSGSNDAALGRDTTNTGIHTLAAMIHVGSGAALTLNDGAEVKNHDNQTTEANGDRGGAIYLEGGTLTMNGTAKIVNNAVSVSPIGDGGAVALWENSTFTMNGGEISGNYAHRYAGGVRVNGSVMNLYGGTIKNNKSTGDGTSTGGAAIYCGNGQGVLNIAPYAAISITNNESPKAGGGIWTNSPLNILKYGSATISITGNKADGKESNVYLSGVVINDQHDDPGAIIGISTATTPTPGHPVKITNGTADNVKGDFKSDDLLKGGISYSGTSVYLDVAEKAVAQVLGTDGTTVKKLYKTFDAAMAAALTDETVELLADCETSAQWTPKTVKIKSEGANKYTLTVKNIVTSANGNYTVTNVKIANGMTADRPEWLHGYSDWTFNGCELPSFAIVGKTVTLTDGTVVSGNIRIDSNALGNLAIKAGDVPVNGTISIHNATSKITLLADSTAASRYNVQYASTITLADSKVVFDGTTNTVSGIAADLAKMVTVSGGDDADKVWVAVGSTNDVILKKAQEYYVKEGGTTGTGHGIYSDPYATVQDAYNEAVRLNATPGIQIRVLSDLPAEAIDLNSAEITSFTMESYAGDNVKATAPWKITRKQASNALLTISNGNVNLTNITLDGKGETLNSDNPLVNVGAGTALTLGDKATLQNNKSSANGGGVATNATATMTMNPGSKITGNSTSEFGGGVYVGGTGGFAFTMNGGEISNNHADTAGKSGGGISLNPSVSGTITINGGKIINNTTACNGTAIHGGNASKLVITGDTAITGNRATANSHLGSAIYQHTGTFAVSGNVNITGNTNLAGEARNVGLESGKTFAIAGPLTGTIGVYTKTAPTETGEVKFATNATQADVAHFSSDIGGRSFVRTGLSSEADETNDCLYLDIGPVPVNPGPDKPDPGVTVEPGPGKVTTWPKNPDPGTKVTITIEPETGWEIDKVIIVTVPGGEPVVITGTDPITYIAPDPNTVKITVKYKRIPVDPKISGVANLLNCDDHIAYMVGVPGGNFDPTRGITRGETAQMFYNLLRNKDIGTVAKFSDVEAAAWYAEAVNALASLKIIEGRGADEFDPSANISRAEFTAIAMRFAIATKGEVTFTDVPGNYWAESAISGAAQYGWIMGYADGSFKPQADITRAEAAKVVNTMLGRFPDKKFIDGATGLKAFPDVKKDYWAFYQIAEATNAHNFTKVKNAETWTK